MNRIKELREKAGLTQGELAQKVGVAQSLMHRWEYNYTPVPERKKEELAAALNCSVDDIGSGEIVQRVTTAAMETRKKWGLSLAKARTEAGMSRAELAKEAGVSWTSIKYWETGICMPKKEILEKLGELFPELEIPKAQEKAQEYKLIVIKPEPKQRKMPRKTPLSRISWTAAEARMNGMDYGDYIAATDETYRDRAYEDYLEDFRRRRPKEDALQRYRRLKQKAEDDRAGYLHRLKEAMADIGIETPTELAIATGVDKRIAGNYCKGNIPCPDALKSICDALGVTDEWLLAG